MKKTKIIVPAMGLLLLGTAGSITGTVAWFSMNNSVAVTGMNVRTTVGSNILISATNSEPSYASSLDQPVEGILEPVSTVNGVDFFYHSTTEHVAGDGHVTDTTFVAYNPDSTAAADLFDANYGLNTTNNAADCYGYKDYSFYIKATNGEAAARTLAMSRCNLTYKGGTVTDKAWRVALFAVATEANAAAIADSTAAQVGNLKSILRLTSAAYFNSQAVASTSTFGSVNAALDAASNIGVINSAATAYYKVVVRLWLEGNDTTCNNETYALLSGDYRLDLKFGLVDHLKDPTPEAGVNKIDSLQNAVATASGLTATVTLSDTDTGTIYNGETAASFEWHNAANDAVVGTDNYQYTAAAACNVYCLVTTARGNIYRTNTVSLA